MSIFLLVFENNCYFVKLGAVKDRLRVTRTAKKVIDIIS